ncbi:SDR family oxidoreductase [Deinococcus sp. KSM4-11]|uniref:SDR family oxidoreductase n=1 Tax=Deinococcus sp. KSM4-11 TaxID=2568654 RepID=UPI0010A3E5DB|nr:SDR family oxidoreductase [Deinococcus sp. KSM4-11]THF87145.1 SDR family oxidoreductase [Deinococcus sp. KSM4-11]
MPSYLITGGAGFIGSHIVDALVQRGDHVTVFDDLSNGRLQNIAHHGDSVRFIQGDLRDFTAVQEAMIGIDYVSHQGALGSVPRSVVDPITTHDVNATGTLNVLQAARQAGVKRVVYASSSSVYGDTPTLPKVETMPTRPISPYALSKLTAEEYCRIFTRVYGLETVSLRYFNVFGPRQRPDSQYAAVIPRFIDAMSQGQRPVINGDGQQSRDFTYVSNNVQANLLAFSAPADQVAGCAFNIACDDQQSLLELVAELNTLLGTTLEPEFRPERAGDVKHSRAGVTAAAAAMGYGPRVTFADGLRVTVEQSRKAVKESSSE